MNSEDVKETKTEISNPELISVKTSELILDLDNPRILGKMDTQDDIREYLLNYEDVTDLAQSINENGILPGDVVVVIEKDGKYVVMEGNRRTAAMQMMLDRGLIPAGQTGIPDINEEIRTIIEKQDAHLVKTREMAEKMMAKRHIEGVKRWKSLAKMNFFYSKFEGGTPINRLSDRTGISASSVRKHIRNYKLFMDTYNEYLELNPDASLDFKKVKVEPFLRPFATKAVYNNVEMSAYDILEMSYDENEKAISDLPGDFFKRIRLQVFNETVFGDATTRMTLTQIEGVKELINEAFFTPQSEGPDETPPAGATSGEPSGDPSAGSGGKPSEGVPGETPPAGDGGKGPGRFFETIKLGKLDETNADHAGLHAATHELFLMSKGSSKMYTKYPVAAGALARCAYEQGIKLLLINAGKWADVKNRNLKDIEKSVWTWLDSSVIPATPEMKKAFDQIYKNSFRDFLNSNIHDIAYLRATQGKLEEIAMGGLLLFVQEVINSL